ncbi:MAG: aldo/keto reductase [Sedimentisphaerales bacterium]|nr:aldo/keto reductase [Sedimentisphaerales bacterium]
MRHESVNRREFLRQSAAGVLAVSLASGATTTATAADAAGAAGAVQERPLPLRPLGKTGEKISMLGLGGHHVGQVRSDQEAIRLVQTAIDMGVTFMDNAWEYHNGRSEEIMGRALAANPYRQKAFLMTKHHGRDKQTALRHLEDSLRRLQTDVIDLWQFHEVVYDKDPDMIFAAGGGIEAAYEAKKAGKVRYVGFTGHKDPNILIKMLAYEYPWDAVQMPLNVLDAHFQSFERNVLPILLQRRIGILAMKTQASGFVLRAQVASVKEALDYVWSLPVSTIISGMASPEHLRQNVQFAREHAPLTEQAKQDLLARSQEAALTGRFEPFKTTRNFDGPVGRALHGIGG